MEIKLITTERVLSPTRIGLADYAINPYRGCEFCCHYCYSRENKNMKGAAFNKFLGVKTNAAALLRKELRYKNPKRVLLGSTTECFQPQELKYGITEKIIALLNTHKIPCTILTKSSLISKYLPLIAKNRKNKIYFTFNFPSDKIIRIFEKNSPPLKKRLKTIAEIIKHKINLRVHIGPFIPYLSSLEQTLEALPPGVREVSLELYHHRMGNFRKVLEIIGKNAGKNLRKKIEKVYETRKNYSRYAQTLKEKIRNLGKTRQCKFFYIIPDFNKFYSTQIDYEKPFI